MNSAWNFGELSMQQLASAFSRYDKNLDIGFQSLIPMNTLSLDLLGTLEEMKGRMGASDVSLSFFFSLKFCFFFF